MVVFIVVSKLVLDFKYFSFSLLKNETDIATNIYSPVELSLVRGVSKGVINYTHKFSFNYRGKIDTECLEL